ncbi:MAG: FkbM family methyltransferase [Mesorhizobium sp.]|nr:FkbM family methyltransferase [Mesorhizobium sp.]
MTAAMADDIVIDARSGRVDNANAVERTAIAALRVALAVLRPFSYFGISYVARAVRMVLPSKRSMVFVLDPDCRMRVAYCDIYWSTLLRPNYLYEKALHTLLDLSRDVEFGFIDGGANHGYWSILVSGQGAGAKKTLAIELAPDTYRGLEQNWHLNGERFAIINRAIGKASGEPVKIYGRKHAARSTIARKGDATALFENETISLDDLARMPLFKGLDKFMVKLDVEGVEVPALEGGEGLLAGDTVFIYEDHGSDRSHETTRHVLDAMKLRVFWLGGDKARELKSADELNRIKKSRRTGYDMIASRSPFWLQRLEAATLVH